MIYSGCLGRLRVVISLFGAKGEFLRQPVLGLPMYHGFGLCSGPSIPFGGYGNFHLASKHPRSSPPDLSGGPVLSATIFNEA